jgi:hypothetical protein
VEVELKVGELKMADELKDGKVRRRMRMKSLKVAGRMSWGMQRER